MSPVCWVCLGGHRPHLSMLQLSPSSAVAELDGCLTVVGVVIDKLHRPAAKITRLTFVPAMCMYIHIHVHMMHRSSLLSTSVSPPTRWGGFDHTTGLMIVTTDVIIHVLAQRSPGLTVGGFPWLALASQAMYVNPSARRLYATLDLNLSSSPARKSHPAFAAASSPKRASAPQSCGEARPKWLEMASSSNQCALSTLERLIAWTMERMPKFPTPGRCGKFSLADAQPAGPG